MWAERVAFGCVCVCVEVWVLPPLLSSVPLLPGDWPGEVQEERRGSFGRRSSIVSVRTSEMERGREEEATDTREALETPPLLQS